MPYSDSYQERQDRKNAAATSDRVGTDLGLAARQEAARKAVTKNDKAAGTADDSEPQAKDFPSLGAWSEAKQRWRANRKPAGAAAVDTLRAAVK